MGSTNDGYYFRRQITISANFIGTSGENGDFIEKCVVYSYRDIHISISS